VGVFPGHLFNSKNKRPGARPVRTGISTPRSARETVVFLLDGTRRVCFVEAQRLVGQIHEVAEDREVPGNRVTRRESELVLAS